MENNANLGFRLLSRSEGWRWLSTIRKNTPNAPATTTQNPIGVSNSHSQVINGQRHASPNRTVDLTTKEDKTTTTMDVVMPTKPQEEPMQGMDNTQNVFVTRHTCRVQDDDDEQQREVKGAEQVRSINERVSDDTPQEEPIQGMDNTQNASVTDHSHRIQDDDEQQREVKGAEQVRNVNGRVFGDTPQEEPIQGMDNSQNVSVTDHTHRIQDDDDEQQREVKGAEQVRNVNEMVSGDTPQEEPIQGMDNTQNVSVTHNTHRVQDDDEQQREVKGAEQVRNIMETVSDDTNQIQEHQEIKDTDQQQNILEDKECENGKPGRSTSEIFIDQFDEDEQKKIRRSSSPKRSWSRHEPSYKNAEGKKDDNLDKDSCVIDTAGQGTGEKVPSHVGFSMHHCDDDEQKKKRPRPSPHRHWSGPKPTNKNVGGEQDDESGKMEATPKSTRDKALNHHYVRNMKSLRPSPQRHWSGPKPTDKHVEGKQDGNLKEESGIMQAAPSTRETMRDEHKKTHGQPSLERCWTGPEPRNKSVEGKKDGNLEEESGKMEAAQRSTRYKPSRYSMISLGFFDDNQQKKTHGRSYPERRMPRSEPRNKNVEGKKDGNLEGESGKMEAAEMSTIDKPARYTEFSIDHLDYNRNKKTHGQGQPSGPEPRNKCVEGKKDGNLEEESGKMEAAQRITRGNSSRYTKFSLDFFDDNQQKTHGQSSPKRCWSRPEPRYKSVEGKKDGNLDEEPGMTEVAPRRPVYYFKNKVVDENCNEIQVPSNMCHQCQRNDKGRVVRCQQCHAKRFCVPCMTTWFDCIKKTSFVLS